MSYVLIIVTLISGCIATLTKTLDDNGKPTKPGWIIFAVLIVGASIQITVEILNSIKEEREVKERIAYQDRTIKANDTTLHLVDSTLRKINLALTYQKSLQSQASDINRNLIT